MLAYELFLKNQKNENEVRKRASPVKKIYVRSLSSPLIQLDTKTLEEYGDDSSNDVVFRSLLSLPYNYLKAVNLPLRNTGSASKKPYIELYSSLKNFKLTITLKGEKKSKYEYSYDFEANKEKINFTGQPAILRLEASKYFVEDAALYRLYLNEKIINSQNELSQELFLAVCQNFVLSCKEKGLLDFAKSSKSPHNFSIILLPYSIYSDSSQIEYREENRNSVMENTFVDSFGSQCVQFPSKTTINAKFLSFDDLAFTLNCNAGENFYKNLGIGDGSFPKINLPSENEFRISGLKWYFIDLTDLPLKFEECKSGIYDQLLVNYLKLAEKKSLSPSRNSVLKVICAREAQAKLEILLDENLTFARLEKLFRTDGAAKRQPMAFESLIVQRNNGPIWSDYLLGIRSFLGGTPIKRDVLLRRYLLILRENYLWNWISGKKLDDKKFFFENSDFCLEKLTFEELKGEKMDSNEEYAYKIGKIAGKYVKFKKASNEANNSTNDVLTYSKYDRDKLRYAFRKIGNSIFLSKASTATLNDLTKFIEENKPGQEIDDAKANDDYSYFFYKGVFEIL